MTGAERSVDTGGAEIASPFPAKRWAAAVAVAAVLLLYFAAIRLPLAEPDEPRYAEIPREMLVRGDWVSPHLNFVKYFEKPPLVYWASAVSYRLFGVSEAAARLPVVLSALLAVGVVYAFARRHYGNPTAALAALILATAPFYCAIGQVLILDMPLTCLVTIALTAFWNGHCGGGRGWYRLAYVATALGVLVKGPVSIVLVGGVAGLHLLLHRDWQGIRRAFDPPGIVIALLIILPWFLLVSWRNPEFFHFFVVDQHLNRYTVSTEHQQPWWLYLAVFPVAFGPWGLMWLSEPGAWRPRLSPLRWSPLLRFLLLWSGFVILFFTLSVSKLVTYIVPAMPPFAVVLARLYLRVLAEGRTAFLRHCALAFLGIGAATGIGAIVARPFVADPRFAQLQPYLFAGGVVLVVTGHLMRTAVWPTTAMQKVDPRRAFTVLIAGFGLLLGVCMQGRAAANQYRDLGLAAGRAMRPGDRLAVYIHYVQGLVFHSRQRVIVVRGRGELRFGSEHATPEDERAFFWEDDARLVREWRGAERLFLVINRTELEPLRAQLDPPPHQVAAQGKKVLIVNRPLDD